MITTAGHYMIDDSYEGQMRLVREIRQQEKERQATRLLNEKLAGRKPNMIEILERYGISERDREEGGQ